MRTVKILIDAREHEMPDLPRCRNCAFATKRESETRRICSHAPTPALQQNSEWPLVYYLDVCGYWRATTTDGSVG